MTQTTKLYETEDESKSITGNFSYSLALLFIPSASTSVAVHFIALDKMPNVKKKKKKNPGHLIRMFPRNEIFQ